MPTLDRRIIVTITGPVTRNEHGEDVPGVVTSLPLWATRIDLTNEDIEQTGGTQGVVTRDFIVRFDDRIASTLTGHLAVVDGGLTMNVTNVTEASGERVERRKFIRIQAVGLPA